MCVSTCDLRRSWQRSADAHHSLFSATKKRSPSLSLATLFDHFYFFSGSACWFSSENGFFIEAYFPLFWVSSWFFTLHHKMSEDLVLDLSGWKKKIARISVNSVAKKSHLYSFPIFSNVTELGVDSFRISYIRGAYKASSGLFLLLTFWRKKMVFQSYNRLRGRIYRF